MATVQGGAPPPGARAIGSGPLLAPPLLLVAPMPHRMFPTVRAVPVLAALLTALPASAASPPEIQCVQQARVDEKTCETQSRDQCNATYLAAVPPCFGANASCATGCLTTQSACQADPHARQASCSAACDQQGKSILQSCHGRSGTCALAAKVKTLKCKQKCARAVLSPLQACTQAFNTCLGHCVAPSP